MERVSTNGPVQAAIDGIYACQCNFFLLCLLDLEYNLVLGRYPGVLEAIVYDVPIHGHDGRAGCAAITLAPAERDTFDWKAFTTYAREKLPRYAVPVFVRVVEGEIGGLAIHNHKQNKVPLRYEGVEPQL